MAEQAFERLLAEPALPDSYTVFTGGGAGAWLARNAQAFGFVQRYSWEPWHYGYLAGCRQVSPVVGVAAAGGLGGYFPPLVMGATYDPVGNNYTVGLLLLVATALVALGYTVFRLHAHEPATQTKGVAT